MRQSSGTAAGPSSSLGDRPANPSPKRCAGGDGLDELVPVPTGQPQQLQQKSPAAVNDRARSPKGTNLMNTLPEHLEHLATLTVTALHVATTQVGDAKVSTMLLPVGRVAGRFETMILGGEHDEWSVRYDSRAAAEIGHASVVEALTEGRSPEYAVQS